MLTRHAYVDNEFFVSFSILNGVTILLCPLTFTGPLTSLACHDVRVFVSK